MATGTPVKTDSVEVLAHYYAPHPCTIVGSAIDCRTKKKATLFLYHGYVENTADTNPGKFLVQVRPDAGDGAALEHWITVAELPAAGTTPDTEALTGTETAGDATLAVASTSGFAVEDELYIQDTNAGSPTSGATATALSGAELNSEWNKLSSLVTNTSITLVDGLTTQKDSSDVIWNDARKWVVPVDLEAVESFRVVWIHQGTTGANGHVKALAITHDSDSIV